VSDKITYQDDGLQAHMEQQSDDELLEAYQIFSTRKSNDPEELQAFRNTAQMIWDTLAKRY
jgi:hypothetical protein